MALVAHFNLELHQMDVKTAFLNGDLYEDIYMTQPEGFIEEGSEHLVCKLKKSIYGLKQASRQWYLKFDSVMASHGFEENPLDECVYLKISGSKFIFLVLYVDDILLASSDLNLLHQTKDFLSRNFEMKDLGEASYVLGIEISRDRTRGLLGLSQRNYIDKILKRFKMDKCASGDAPMTKGDLLHKDQCPRNNLEQEAMKDKPYASLVGSLMYAQVCTRPDLAYSVGMLGRFQTNPGHPHWVAGKKVLRYLQGTRDHLLVYKRVEGQELTVIGYSDADYIGKNKSKIQKKSTSGFIFMLAGGAISWKSVKQTCVTTSTMHAEFVALYEATIHAVWLRNFIKAIKVVDSIHRPLQIFCDNSAAVFFSKNNKRSSKTKFVDPKHLLVREKVKHDEILVEHISGEDMLADPFTKPLAITVYKEHVVNMGLIQCFDMA
jgi:hypothetical protein